MTEDVSFHAAIEALYLILLARPPILEEVEAYSVQFKSGVNISGIAETIMNCPEHRSRAVSQAMQFHALPDIPTYTGKRAVEISAVDLMNTIAHTYEILLKRRPSFHEVAERFKAIVGGDFLSDHIKEILASPEAISTTNNPVKPAFTSLEEFRPFIEIAYRRVLRRRINEDEIDIWYNHHKNGAALKDILIGIDGSDEAKETASRSNLDSYESATFIQALYEIVLGRGATPIEIEHYRRAMETGELLRKDLLSNFFVQAARDADPTNRVAANDPTEAHLFGQTKHVNLAQWKAKGKALEAEPRQSSTKHYARFKFESEKKPLVSIITSLYRGGKFIENFLDNITNQTIFKDHCELIIIDANSPEGEMEKAEPYLKQFQNIKYLRYENQVTIYDAWNIGVREARGDYCTNANLDDCRRSNSLELQAATLNALPFVDVVYQDVLYSFSENMKYEEIERYDFVTNLPIVGRYNLLEFNLPHNGPMWRKRLHHDVGFFDPAYRSAGDFDFWMRCHIAGKTFYKLNDPHVAYYVNPQGLSTRSDTPGAAEANRITRLSNRHIISPCFVMNTDRFAERLGNLAGQVVEGPSRYAMTQAALRAVSVSSRAMARKGY